MLLLLMLFFTCCDAICDILQYTHTGKCYPFVKYILLVSLLQLFSFQLDLLLTRCQWKQEMSQELVLMPMFILLCLEKKERQVINDLNYNS